MQLVLLTEHRVALGDAALRRLHAETIGLVAQLLHQVRAGSRVEVGDAARGKVGSAGVLRAVQIGLPKLAVEIGRLLVELSDLPHCRRTGEVDLAGVQPAEHPASHVGDLLLIALLRVEDVLLRLVELGVLRPLTSDGSCSHDRLPNWLVCVGRFAPSAVPHASFACAACWLASPV